MELTSSALWSLLGCARILVLVYALPLSSLNMIATSHASPLASCVWEATRLATPHHAPPSLIAQTLLVSEDQLEAFQLRSKRLKPLEASASLQWWLMARDTDQMWRWPTPLELGDHISRPHESEGDLDLYARCVTGDQRDLGAAVNVNDDSSRASRLRELWSTHPFELWRDETRVGRGILSDSGRYRLQIIETQPRASTQWLIRFKPRRGQVTWSLRKLSASRGVKGSTRGSGLASSVVARPSPEASLEIYSSLSPRRPDTLTNARSHQVLAPLIKPLAPLPSAETLRRVSSLLTDGHLRQPQVIQRTGLTQLEGASGEARVTQVDLLTYSPAPHASQSSQPLNRNASPEVTWRVQGRSLFTLEAYDLYTTARSLRDEGGFWLLMSARFVWRLPIWLETWEARWTPLPTQLYTPVILSERGNRQVEGWVQIPTPRSHLRPDLPDLEAWVSAATPAPRGGADSRAMWSWSAFETWDDVRAIYARGVEIANTPSPPAVVAPLMSLNPAELSPGWVELSAAHKSLSVTALRPVSVRWPAPRPIELSERLKEGQDEANLLSVGVQASLLMTLPQLERIPSPLSSSTALDPGYYALRQALDQRATLTLWSPPQSHPFPLQPRPLLYWGIRQHEGGSEDAGVSREMGQRQDVQPQALNRTLLPKGSQWLEVAPDVSSKAEVISPNPQSGRAMSAVSTVLNTVSEHHRAIRSRELTIRVDIQDVPRLPDRARVKLTLSPLSSTELFGVEAPRSAPAIPEQLMALASTTRGAAPRQRWWSGLRDGRPAAHMSAWRQLLTSNAARAGLTDFDPHLSIRHERERGDLARSLEGWWISPLDQLWIPTHTIDFTSAIAMETRAQISSQLIVTLSPKLLEAHCQRRGGWRLRDALSASLKHSGGHWSYERAWSQTGRGSRARLRLTSSLTAFPREPKRDEPLLKHDQEVAQLDRLTDLCLTPDAVSSLGRGAASNLGRSKTRD